jgi:hypothetical protein
LYIMFLLVLLLLLLFLFLFPGGIFFFAREGFIYE